MKRLQPLEGGDSLVHAIGEAGITDLEDRKRFNHRDLPVQKQIIGIDDHRNGLDDLLFVESKAAAQHPLQFKQNSHWDEELAPHLQVMPPQSVDRDTLMWIVLDDASNQDVRVDGAHQRNGSMSSMATVIPLGGVRRPIKSLSDLVLAPT